MIEDQKFYLTPTMMIDAEVIGDAQYFPVGSPSGSPYREFSGDDPFGEKPMKQDLRKKSELHISFKKHDREDILLYGHEADQAWKNFRLVAGPTTDRLVLMAEEMEREKLAEIE